MSTTTRRLVAVASVVAAAALAVAACGGADDAGGPEAAAVTGPAGPPTAGGEATMLIYTEPARLDPAALVNSSTADSTIGNALYGQLFTDDPQTGAVVPGIGDALTTSDGIGWAVKIRSGVTFSDGTPLDAQALKFNWDRHKDRAVASRSASAANAIAAMDVLRADTLSVSLVERNFQFGQIVVNSALNWIASPAALAAGTQAFDQNPVGAGPFALGEWRRQDQIILSRNARYYDAPRPHLDRLTLKAVPDNDSRFATVQSGGADLAIANVEMAGRAAGAGMWLASDPLNGIVANLFNVRRAPFDDPETRRAVVQAVDLATLAEVLYQGHERPPQGLFRPGSPFHDSAWGFAPHDPAAAEEHFDELASEGRPLSFTITVLNLSETVMIAQAIQAQLEGFGNVRVEVRAVDSATRAAQLSSGDFDMVNVNMAFGDPEPLLYQSLITGSPQNYSGISDEQLDAALVQGRTAADLDGRKAAYRVVQERWNALHPAMPVSPLSSLVIAGRQVGGVAFYGNGSVRSDGMWRVAA